MFDVLISGGQIIDGLGNVGFRGSVGVEGDTVRVLRGDVSVEQYLALFDQPVAVNIRYLVGNSPLRIAAVGWQERAATPAEQADMHGRALRRGRD